MSSDSPLEIAKKLGAFIGGELGRKAFQELEFAFVNSVLPRFSDNPIIRMKQHLLFYWDQSYFKTTLVDEFCKCVPDTVKVVNITTNSPEILFGGINERDRIVYPAFIDAKIAAITELATFVTGRNSQEIVNTMNKIMEGEQITRQLLKFGRRELPQQEIDMAEAMGIHYNALRAQLSYKPDVSIFACSRPFDNRTYTYFKTSGHLHRFHVLQHEISDQEAKNYLVRSFKPDFPLYERLRKLNEQFAAIQFKEVRMPDESIQKEIFDNLTSIVEDETRDRKVRLATIIDMRTKGDILRELVAHAAIRTACKNAFQNIEEIEYDLGDCEFITANIEHFVEAKINPLFTFELSKPSTLKQGKKQQTKSLILEFLNDGNERNRQEIDTYISSKIIVCEATVSNALQSLVKDGKILHRFGHYRVSN